MSSRYAAVEVTAPQAWWIADSLGIGSYPWKLAVTIPFIDPGEQEAFNAQCIAELAELGVLDSSNAPTPSLAEAVRGLCHSPRRLEWLTITSQDQILRGILARTSDGSAVAAFRHAQMVTITPMELFNSEAIVPIVTAGLTPDQQQPARFAEFEIPMDFGAKLDQRVAGGGDLADLLTDLGVDESAAEAMAAARSGHRTTVEITAVDGQHHTDVSVNLIATDIGLILASPTSGGPKDGGVSLFSPADPFDIAMAIRSLTDRLPSGCWFPDESFSI